MKQLAIKVALVAVLLLATPGMASAIEPQRSDPHWALKVVDAVFLRPPLVVASTASTVVCAGFLPFAWPAQVADDLIDNMIGDAWDLSVTRPLGDFSD
jgi:hypothetical protein